jgi:CBS domain-containing protein
MLTVRDLMIPEPVTIGPQESLRAAADLLTSTGISGAPVVAGDRVVGMISLADIVAFEAEDPGVPVFRPDLGDPFEDIDPDEADGKGDPAAWFATLWEDSGSEVSTRLAKPDGPEWDPLDEHTVSEVMSRVLFRVAPLTPLTDAARLMEKERIHRLLVVDDELPVGILTAWDIVRAVARGELTTAGAGPSLIL